MIGRTIKTLIASLMLGTLACCCVSLSQTQTRAATVQDKKKMSDQGRAATVETVLKQTDGIEKKGSGSVRRDAAHDVRQTSVCRVPTKTSHPRSSDKLKFVGHLPRLSHYQEKKVGEFYTVGDDSRSLLRQPPASLSRSVVHSIPRRMIANYFDLCGRFLKSCLRNTPNGSWGMLKVQPCCSLAV